jgi:hypothetical protein
MRNKTFHTGDVRTSSRLQIMDEILKEASGPMTIGELSEASRPYPGALPRIVNPGTTLNELRANPGYEIAGGIKTGRFPDGTFKYWLVAAPGWSARWIVREFRVLPVGRAATAAQRDRPATSAPAAPEEVRFCSNPECKKPLTVSLPWCDKACQEAWRTLVLLQPGEKPQPQQGSMF